MLMSDIRRLDDEQLKLEADSLRRKLFEMRSQKATAKIEDTSVMRTTSSTDMLTVLTRCNGKLQRTMRIEEAETANCRDSDDGHRMTDETQPLVTETQVPGLKPTQNRCHVQTSGWL